MLAGLEWGAQALGRFVGARQHRNSVAQGVVLAGNELGGQPLAHTETYTVFVPCCVSTVLCKTLSEAESPGLEGLDAFFFFDKFWLWTKFIKKPTRRGKTPDLR